MSTDEVPLSIHALDQAWFSMLLVNDPNTALIGSLRPARQHGLWAALRRPFERPVPVGLEGCAGAEEMRALRPRSGRWIAAGLLIGLGVGLASVGLDASRMAAAAGFAAFWSEPLSSATPSARPVRSPALETTTVASIGTPNLPLPHDTAMLIVANVVPLAQEPNAQALTAVSPVLGRTSKAAALSAKRKPAARPLRRQFGRALTGRLSTR